MLLQFCIDTPVLMYYVICVRFIGSRYYCSERVVEELQRFSIMS